MTEVHHADAVGEVLDHRQVVGDEQDGDARLLAQLPQQVDDLRLYGHVQRRHRLVGDDQLGLHDDGPGHADALALSAGELVGIAVGVLRQQSNLTQHLQHHAVDLLFILHAPDAQALGDDLLDGHAGIQRGHGILKDHLNLGDGGVLPPQLP